MITFTLPSSLSSSNSSSSSNLFQTWHVGQSPFHLNFRQFSEIANSTIEPIQSTSSAMTTTDEVDKNINPKMISKKKLRKRIQNFFSKFF